MSEISGVSESSEVSAVSAPSEPAETEMTDKPETSEIRRLLGAAVEGLGGARRDGQIAMAEAVAQAFADGEHLAVQAGTGTGKSLAYLVPAIAQALADNRPVVVSTATIALQRQLVDRDLPRLHRGNQRVGFNR